MAQSFSGMSREDTIGTLRLREDGNGVTYRRQSGGSYRCVAGTTGTLVLADLGADVIKIEPLRGEHYRTALDGAFLLAMNRNKSGVAIDLKTKEGQDIVMSLVKKADVFVENFVPGTIEKLGLSYERVKGVKPDIIYCSVSGFGQEGPMSRRPSYDPVAQAMAGIMIATGEADGKPCRQVTSLIDMTAGLYAIHSDTGQPEQTQLYGTGTENRYLHAGYRRLRHELLYSPGIRSPATYRRAKGRARRRWTPYQAFDTKDKPVWIGVSTDKFWRPSVRRSIWKIWAKDERYANDRGRREHREELVAKVADICMQYTSEELDRRLQEVGRTCRNTGNGRRGARESAGAVSPSHR